MPLLCSLMTLLKVQVHFRAAVFLAGFMPCFFVCRGGVGSARLRFAESLGNDSFRRNAELDELGFHGGRTAFGEPLVVAFAPHVIRMAADFQLLATVHLDSFRYDLQLAFGTLGKGIFIKAEEQGQGIAALGIFTMGIKMSSPAPCRFV